MDMIGLIDRIAMWYWRRTLRTPENERRVQEFGRGNVVIPDDGDVFRHPQSTLDLRSLHGMSPAARVMDLRRKGLQIATRRQCWQTKQV